MQLQPIQDLDSTEEKAARNMQCNIRQYRGESRWWQRATDGERWPGEVIGGVYFTAETWNGISES